MNNQLRLPNIGEFVRNVGTLIKVDEIQPPPPQIVKEYIFEEISARVEIRFNGEQIKYLETLNDFYGLGTSIESAIEDAKGYATSYKINADNDLEIVVIKIVSQYRAKQNGRESIYQKEFYNFSSLDTYDRQRDLPEPIETVVWSTKSVKESASNNPNL